jgi:hypothetical protein
MGYQPKSAIRRRRIKHEASFEMRLAKAARQAREAAELLPPGLDREMLLRKASACDTAAQIHQWISAPGTSLPEEVVSTLADKAPHGGA